MENIYAKGLSFTYPTSEYPTLSNISFEIKEGEFCLLVGKSAAGKSTLLKLLKKEIAPAGKLEGELVCNANVGYVAQNVEENIVTDKVRSELAFGLTNMGWSREKIDLTVAETASYFNLSSKLDNDISTLSGGEKQILNLASVMIMNPSVLVLDEPTCQLDPVWAERFVSVIKKLHRDFGTTIIIAEHLLEEIYTYANSVMVIENGEKIAMDEPAKVRDYLRSSNNDLLYSLPACMTLFDDCITTTECRNKLKEIQPPELSKTNEAVEKVVTVKNISFAYRKNEDILNSLSLEIYKGKINVILGPNSSGKSTLLKTICGVQKQHHGKIKANGKISMLCQNPRDLFTKEKCEDEVTFGETTTFLEIDNIKNQHPYDISGGEAQRLALAKLLETNADVLLLDEPTKALDTAFKNKLGEKLKALCQMEKTIVITTHDIDFAGEFGDYISFLSSGEIITTLPRAEFFTSVNFYTTSVSRITNGIAFGYASFSDLAKGGIK